MSTSNETPHIFTVSCDMCGKSAPDARTRVQARANAIHTGWKFPIWWNGQRHEKRDICPKCAPDYLENLSHSGIVYTLGLAE